MNKLIEKFSDQAWVHARAIHRDYLAESGKANWAFFETYDKKFAELIVQECAEFVKQRAEVQSDLGIKTMLKITGQQVKEHFGVEE